MSDTNNANQSGSFSHAFLPGLILGLVIGAVAGAFLPDWLGGGNKIPAPTGEYTPGQATDRDGEPVDPMTQDDVVDMIEDETGNTDQPAEPPADPDQPATTPPGTPGG